MRKVVPPFAVIAAGVLIVVCCGGELYGLAPFGAPMFCALVPHVPVWFIAPVYVLCAYLFSFELNSLYAALAVSFVMAASRFLALKLPRLKKDVASILFSLFALLINGVIAALTSPVPQAALSLLLSLIFYYFSRQTALAAKRGFSFKPDALSGAAICVTLFVAGLCFGRAKVDAAPAGLAPAYLLVLFLTTAGVKQALAGSVAISLGLAFGFGPQDALAFLAGCGVAACFIALPRAVAASAGVGAHAAVAIIFGSPPVYVGWAAIVLALGALPYCVLPRRAIKAIRSYFDFDGSARLAVRHYINRTRSDAGNRVLLLASAFDEAARLMNVMRDPEPDFKAMGDMLADKFCPYCPAAYACDEKKRAAEFTRLAERAYSGKPIITDIPKFFTDSCSRTADIIGAASELGRSAEKQKLSRASDDKAKATVVERLSAVKEVLENVGSSQALPVGFDGDAEDAIAAELSLRGVECAQVFVTREGVTAIVRTPAADAEKMRRAVSACMKARYELVSLDKTQAAGWSVAYLKKRPRYEAVYARAGVSKSGGVSGDSYTFERIGDRFLVALADGMGAGEAAGRSSGAAVDLIECFYRAGFDSAAVLAGVNRFLKLPSSERYSAADVAVCDLDTACVDVIKLGAPACYIKTADTVLLVEGKSLPIGVLDEMKPYMTTKRLYPGQMLILVTDGVSDCFTGDELPEYINGLGLHNPAALAESIIDRALKKSGGTPKDDMTVVAFRVIEVPKKRLFIRV